MTLPTTNLDCLKVFLVYLGSINSRGTAFGFIGERMTAFVFRLVSLCYSGTVWITNCVSMHTSLCLPLFVYIVYLFLGQPFPCVGFDTLPGSENTFDSRIHLRSTLCANETV